jgi:hypothetical protein
MVGKYHDSVPQQGTLAVPVLNQLTLFLYLGWIPLVTAIKSNLSNPPLSLTLLSTFAKFLAWKSPTVIGTIPPCGSDKCNDLLTMLCRITGADVGEGISRTATHVSSHDVSMPSTVNCRMKCRGRARWLDAHRR